MPTIEEISFEHKAFAETIIGKYYFTFKEQVENKNDETAQKFIEENQKALSTEIAELTMDIAHKYGAIGNEKLMLQLRDNGLVAVIDLRMRMKGLYK